VVLANAWGGLMLVLMMWVQLTELLPAAFLIMMPLMRSPE
jgi:hypothetical protein